MKLADSLMPITSKVVTTATIKIAGKLMIAPVVAHTPVAESKENGAFESEVGMIIQNL